MHKLARVEIVRTDDGMVVIEDRSRIVIVGSWCSMIFGLDGCTRLVMIDRSIVPDSVYSMTNSYSERKVGLLLGVSRWSNKASLLNDTSERQNKDLSHRGSNTKSVIWWDGCPGRGRFSGARYQIDGTLYALDSDEGPHMQQGSSAS